MSDTIPSVSSSQNRSGAGSTRPAASALSKAILVAAATAIAAVGVAYYVNNNRKPSNSTSDSASSVPPLTTNTALIFIKPHAHSPKVIDFVEKELSSHGIRIVRRGQIRGDAMEEKGTIDAHYAAIGMYAMKVPAKDLILTMSPQRKSEFFNKYNISVEDAVAEGKLLNAAEFMRRYGWDGLKVSESFERAKALTMFKVAPGCYTAKLDNGVIVVNGFYLKMRAEYVNEHAEVSWAIIQWDERNLRWASFRSDVLGATDPTSANPNSIRAKLMNKATTLGLGFTPTMATNCVHGSASPLEALHERMVWAGVGRVESDPYGQYLISRGLSADVIGKMLKNAKVTDSGQPIFDVVEDMDSAACATKLVELSAKL